MRKCPSRCWHAHLQLLTRRRPLFLRSQILHSAPALLCHHHRAAPQTAPDSMPKAKAKSKASEAEPVMELRVDASNPDSPAFSEPGAEAARFSTPCSLTGLGAGISGGSLGWVFGFGKRRDDGRRACAGRRAPACCRRQVLPSALTLLSRPIDRAAPRWLLDPQHARGTT